MFRPTPDGKHLVELSLKQRTQLVAYTIDRYAQEWPALPVKRRNLGKENIHPMPGLRVIE
jgi:hypothetical protein